MKDFPDQTNLAGQSRAVLAKNYGTAAAASPAPGNQNDRANFEMLMEVQKQEEAKTDAARARYRATIEEEMAFDEKQLS